VIDLSPQPNTELRWSHSKNRGWSHSIRTQCPNQTESKFAPWTKSDGQLSMDQRSIQIFAPWTRVGPCQPAGSEVGPSTDCTTGLGQAGLGLRVTGHARTRPKCRVVGRAVVSRPIWLSITKSGGQRFMGLGAWAIRVYINFYRSRWNQTNYKPIHLDSYSLCP